jgi:Glycoside-hydrolase family GH114
VNVNRLIPIAIGIVVVAAAIGAFVIWRSLGRGYWVPPANSTFLIKLGSPFDTASPTDLGDGEFNYLGNPAKPPTVYDIDGNNNPSTTVDQLHNRGAHVICYVPVGEWTPYIYDANDPRWAPLKGQVFNGTDRWLNTNPSGPYYSTLLDLEAQQFENCKSKGFDAIQPDGTDEAEGHGVSFNGSPLTVAEVNAYLIKLTEIAHSVGLSIGQLGYLDQTRALEPYFDFAIVESCFPAGVCGMTAPYATAHKAIFEIEYTAAPTAFCPAALAAGRVAGRYDPSLNGKLRIPCT